jgi:Raf kinase inhibitor-like YbhB/YbcL family protein
MKHSWGRFKSSIQWLFFMGILAACSAGGGVDPAQMAGEEGVTMAIEFSSSAFEDGAAIPKKYSCDGEDISPALSWDNLPAGTESLALIMDDPDAPRGTWVHWVVYDIPPESAGFLENISATGDAPGGGKQGNNSWKRIGYGGPCPPGGTHRYFFKLYALDTVLGIEMGATKEELLKAMEGHVLDQGQLMGTFSR